MGHPQGPWARDRQGERLKVYCHLKMQLVAQ